MENDSATQHIWTINNGSQGCHSSPRIPVPGSIRICTPAPSQTGDCNEKVVSGIRRDIHEHPFLSLNLIGVQSKIRRKYYHKLLFTVLILVIIILVIFIIVLCIKNAKSIEICESNECIRTAAGLIYAMDTFTDPCEDFYQFTCGNWPKEHPRPDSVPSNDWFRESQLKIMREVRQFLQSNISELQPEAVGKAKRMFRACMNTDLLDKLQLKPMLDLITRCEIPVIPSAINITLSKEGSFKYANSSEFKWIHSLVLIKKILGMDLIVGFDIFPDPFNRSINRIALGTPETDSVLPFNSDDPHRIAYKIHRKQIFGQEENNGKNDSEICGEDGNPCAKKNSKSLNAYIEYVNKIVELYMNYLDPDADDQLFDVEMLTIQAIKVAKKIYKLKAESENSTKPATNPSDDIVYVSTAELQNRTDELISPLSLPIWEEYLSLMMANASLPKAFTANETKIITSNADILYLQNIVEYLSQLPPEIIEFYVWLSVVEELIIHTSSEMRLLHSEYMRLIIGTEGSIPRSIHCAQGVNSLMGMAASFTLTDDHFTNKKLPRVRQMLNYIRQSFNNLVLNTSWMDAQTKRETLHKSALMKSYIGYPDWITNVTMLNAYYKGVKVAEDTYLLNMISVLSWQMQQKLDSFQEPGDFSWATSPSNVNAFHTFQSNAITIPIAILQYPFYDLGLEALNYGSIGTILGHELTHGFDDSGRMFDKNGNMVQWWSNETIKEYVNRTECFVDKYSHYYLADIGEYIDGELTLGENIADNGGMREAFHAYKLYTQRHGREKRRLPGLEQFTHEQLFFISFGNLWCEAYTPAASWYALQDSHCPGKIRLQGVLSNSHEFAETFQCRKGTQMNPEEKKCRIW